MEPIDNAYQKFQTWKSETAEGAKTLNSESDVRMKVLDSLLTDVLGWTKQQIATEETAGTGFLDYKISIESRARLIVEAKKDARDLEVNAKHSGKFYKLNGPVFKSKTAKEGIAQAIQYAAHKNAELAAVTNGRQWIIFRANRLGDGKDTLDGRACAFSDIDSIDLHFRRFFELLSFDAVSDYGFRAVFQQAEGEPIQSTSFCKPIRSPEHRKLLPIDPISTDIDRVMTQFFRTLSEPEMRRACFVTSPESDLAEARLARISEELLSRVQQIETDEGSRLAETIRRVDDTQMQAFGLLVGTKGAGKSTFVERFFADVLPSDLSSKCAVIRIDLAESDGDERTLTDWLNSRLLREAEKALFEGSHPTYDQLQGMYFDEYKRWSEGPYQHLYNSDKTAFKHKFGEHVEEYRKSQPLDYIIRLLTRSVRSEKRIPCLVFDNGDHFTIEFQERVFQYAKAASNRVICMTLLPITDKTSWQLSRQGALQSFYTETFHLPTPSPRAVLLKRIQYLDSIIADEKPVRGTGYGFGSNMTLSVGDLKGFVNCLQGVFIDSGNVAEWIGRLSNNDIRRCLKLVRETITSPRIANYELVQAYVAKSAVEIDSERAKEAIIYGRYDTYPAGQHEFVQNLFALHTEIATTPLLGVRILMLLQDAQHQEPDGDAKFIPVEDIETYILQMGVDVSVTRQWLDSMLKAGLCWSYDPTTASVKNALRIETSPSGIQHLAWAQSDLSYLESMMLTTPLRDQEVHANLTAVGDLSTPLERRQALSRFISYLLDSDESICLVPEHSAYESQRAVRSSLRSLVDTLCGPIALSDSKKFGLHQGRVVSWKDQEGYGFLEVDGIDEGVFVHVTDIRGNTPLAYGELVECEIVTGKQDKPKAVSVRVLSGV